MKKIYLNQAASAIYSDIFAVFKKTHDLTWYKKGLVWDFNKDGVIILHHLKSKKPKLKIIIKNKDFKKKAKKLINLIGSKNIKTKLNKGLKK